MSILKFKFIKFYSDYPGGNTYDIFDGKAVSAPQKLSDFPKKMYKKTMISGKET